VKNLYEEFQLNSVKQDKIVRGIRGSLLLVDCYFIFHEYTIKGAMVPTVMDLMDHHRRWGTGAFLA